MNSAFDVKHLFRYIRKRRNNYLISKEGQYFGTFHTIEAALLERDILESVGWNENTIIDLPTIQQNWYKEIPLPPFPENRRQLIPLKKHILWNGSSYVIQKRINGEQEYFGSYRTFEEAREVRDLLIETDWDKSVIDKFKKETTRQKVLI